MFTSICMINVQVGIPELNPTDTMHWSGHKMFSSTVLYVELKPLILAVRFVAEDCSPNGAHPSHPRMQTNTKCYCRGGHRNCIQTLTSGYLNSVISEKESLNFGLLICEVVLLQTSTM